MSMKTFVCIKPSALRGVQTKVGVEYTVQGEKQIKALEGHPCFKPIGAESAPKKTADKKAAVKKAAPKKTAAQLAADSASKSDNADNE